MALSGFDVDTRDGGNRMYFVSETGVLEYAERLGPGGSSVHPCKETDTTSIIRTHTAANSAYIKQEYSCKMFPVC